jgi:hypothetical protein
MNYLQYLKKLYLLVFSLIATYNIIYCSTVYAADTTPPTTSVTLDPATPNGKNSWYITPISFTLSATDLDSGIQSINYKIDAAPWQTVNFNNTLNVAPNPSFEEIDGGNTPPTEDWAATVLDANTTYLRDTTTYAPGYESSSAKITTTEATWHGINNQLSFASATPLSNMSASVQLKTSGVTGSAYFNVYLVTDDGAGNKTYTYIASSNAVTGTVDWTTVSANFVANSAQAVGVYLDIGLVGPGTVWADAVSITNTTTASTTNFTVGTNGTHKLEYYSVDNTGNTETHSCIGTLANCETFKIDQDPPGSWHDAGAVRGQGGSDHELFVFANVSDGVSGMSSLSDKYMYHVDTETGFGRYEELLHCNTPWQQNTWVDLTPQPFADGTEDVQLKTQKTDFCNDNWKICKTVRFYAEDMAGNSSSKDFCLNGPWISFIGGGTVRSNGGIDMVAEPVDDNSDGLIDVGNNLVSFFSTSTDWEVTDSTAPKEYDFDDWLASVRPSPTTVSSIQTTSGVYRINGNFELKNTTIPNSFGSATFNQIIFINGNLTISSNVSVGTNSTALFIVNGNVSIEKNVTTVGIAIFADGEFSTAYNISEGQTANTLEFKGLYIADKFNFQRTLQGANNSKYPSESFTYEPKYAVKLADYLGANSIKWISTE